MTLEQQILSKSENINDFITAFHYCNAYKSETSLTEITTKANKILSKEDYLVLNNLITNGATYKASIEYFITYFRHLSKKLMISLIDKTQTFEQFYDVLLVLNEHIVPYMKGCMSVWANRKFISLLKTQKKSDLIPDILEML